MHNFQKKRHRRFGLLAGLILGGSVFAQTAENSSPASGASGTLAQFQQERMALDQQWQTLVSEGATQAQLEAWQLQNAPEFEAQLQMALALATASALEPMPVIDWISFSTNASTALQDYLMTRATLANRFAQLHNQFLQGMSSGATQDDVNTMQEQERQSFLQQNAGDLRIVGGQAQVLAAESASTPLPLLGPAVIPPNATPQLQAYLIARITIANAQAQVRNQYLTADPGVEAAAMQQWAQQNASSLEQLDQLAQDLANSTANQQENNQ